MTPTKILRIIRNILIFIQYRIYTKGFGMQIHKTARISPFAVLDRTNPKGVVIGKGSYVAAKALILAHDHVGGRHLRTEIGENCFIGYGAIILPGITIHDSSIVAAGSVVTKDVGPGCIVAGNPARVIKQGITTGEFGQMKEIAE